MRRFIYRSTVMTVKKGTFNKNIDNMVLHWGRNLFTLDMVLVDYHNHRLACAGNKKDTFSMSLKSLRDSAMKKGFTEGQFLEIWDLYLEKGIITEAMYRGFENVVFSHKAL